MDASTCKQPSAVIPVVMSLSALAIVLFHVAIYGTAREADEGTTAHLFQMLMAGQLPFIAWFAVRWIPQKTRGAMQVLALQCGAALAALAPVFFLHL